MDKQQLRSVVGLGDQDLISLDQVTVDHVPHPGRPPLEKFDMPFPFTTWVDPHPSRPSLPFAQRRG